MSYNENSDIMISVNEPTYVPHFYDPLQSYQNPQDYYPGQASIPAASSDVHFAVGPIEEPDIVTTTKKHKKQKKKHNSVSMFKMTFIIFIIFAMLFGAGYYYDQ